tara:strand:- start:14400 stop:15296 length:897 start_codon:yes stop_codon:yes gene_type:complete
MGVSLMEIFEKYSFPNAAIPREDYHIPAPNSKKYAEVEETPLEDAHFYFDDEDDDDLDDDLLDDDEDEPLVDEGQLVLMVRGLNKVYKQGSNTLNILNNVDLRLYSGEICALVGPSGSGKSTLLHILGLLDSPTSGQILMDEQDVSRLSERTRTKLRSQHIGFVYQFHHLLPEFSALENVALAQIIAGKKPEEANEKAEELLVQLGLADRLKHRPATLSGGEQQRVAIARALVNDPYLLFADEPTGNLDPETSEEVFDMLLNLVRKRGVGALIATHNIKLAHEMDRILEVKSGRILPY